MREEAHHAALAAQRAHGVAAAAEQQEAAVRTKDAQAS
jgi:hypothetical protein